MASAARNVPRPDPEIALLLHLLDEAFEKKAWHGPNLLGVLRGVDVGLASFRPAPGRHTVWELALHAAYWKFTVRSRLTGAGRGGFPRKGSNWFVRPAPGLSAADWAADVALLKAEHRALRAVVASFPPEKLHARVGSTAHTHARLIAGAAAHDLYHCGQISLVKRLAT